MNRYPLTWPAGWKRTEPGRRIRGKFGRATKFGTEGSGYVAGRPLTMNEAITRLLGELHRMGIQYGNAIISTNVPVRLDGLPRGDQREPQDPGAAVYWERGKSQKVMAIDLYTKVADNIAALAATIEAMRAIERHGGTIVLERAFTGFDALPAPGQTAVRGWREVLGVGSLPATMSDVEATYKALRSKHHPDKGGSAETFHAVQMAYEQARAEIGSSGTSAAVH